MFNLTDNDRNNMSKIANAVEKKNYQYYYYKIYLVRSTIHENIIIYRTDLSKLIKMS